MRLKLFNFSAVAFLGLVSLAIAGCNRSNEINVVTPLGEKLKLLPNETLRVNLATEPPSLDPQLLDDTTSAQVVNNIMDGLVGYDLKASAEKMKFAPSLATKWESSKQATVWKFTIRQGVKWSDGVPFTPQHAIDGVMRLLAKETASPYAYMLFNIVNAKPFNEAKVGWDQVGVKQTGDWEITFTLDKPMGFFPALFGHTATFPARLDIVKKFGPLWTQPENIVTIGAYKLKVWQHDNLIVLQRNDDYWGEKAQTKFVAMYMIQELMTALNLFDSGRLDSVLKFPSIEYKKRRPTKEYHEAGSLLMAYYGFNVTKPPMDNLNLRKAINAAIDRKEITKMLNGGEQPLPCWLVPGVLGYSEKVGIGFDLAKAKEYLKLAGYNDASKIKKIELKFNTNEDVQRVAENVQAQLRRNLGLNIEIKQVEWKVYLKELRTNAPTMFRFGWMADYADPDNFMTVMNSDSENNNTRYKSKKFDELVARAGSLVDDNQRAAVYHEAEKLMCETDVPIIPLYSARNHLLISQRVSNYPINVLERYEFKGVRVQ